MLMLSTGTLTAYLTAQRIEYELQTMEIRALSLAKNMAISASTHLITGQYTQIEEILDLYAHYPEVMSIQITDEQGKPLLKVSNITDTRTKISYGGKLIPMPATAQTKVVHAQNKMTLWQPIEGGTLIGWVMIEYDLKELRANQAKTLQHGLSIGVLAVVVSTILFLIVLAPSVRAIGRAATFARKLNQHRGEAFTPDYCAEELGQLGEALNEASFQLHQQEANLTAAIAELRDSEEKFRAVSDSANEAIVTADSTGQIVYLNKAAAMTFGYAPNELIGMPLTSLMPKKLQEAHQEGFQRFLKTGETHVMGKTVELVGARKDGSEFPLELSLTSWHTVEGQFFSGVMRDITERKIAEARILELTLTDELTGLNNRRGFFTLAQAKLPLARRMCLSLQLFYIDLDGMKSINDTLGHLEGDRALCDTADLLRKSFRNPDLIARLGGDEFLVLTFHNTDNPQELIIARLQANVAKFNQTAHRPYQLAMSVGSARFDPESTQSLDDAVAESDAAMYRCKQQRKTKLWHDGLAMR